MTKKFKHSHRELKLLEVLRRLGGSARSVELAKALDVSEETVRRAIKSLSKTGALERIYGGAHLVDDQGAPSYFRRIAEHSDEKQVIAAATVEKVQDGMTLFLDVGSTTAFVAEKLRQRFNLTVATNSVGIAQVLANHNGNRVHLLGGEMQSDERGTFGFVTEQHARRFAYDLAIISADALSANRGFLYLNVAEANLANVVAGCAERLLVTVDHFKFDQTAPHRGPDAPFVTEMITDRAPPKELATALSDWGIKTQIAGEGSVLV